MRIVLRWEDKTTRKTTFAMKWLVIGIYKALVKMILCLGDFNGHVGGRIDGSESVYGGIKLAKEMMKEEDCSSLAMERVVWGKHMV